MMLLIVPLFLGLITRVQGLVLRRQQHYCSSPCSHGQCDAALCVLSGYCCQLRGVDALRMRAIEFPSVWDRMAELAQLIYWNQYSKSQLQPEITQRRFPMVGIVA